VYSENKIKERHEVQQMGPRLTVQKNSNITASEDFAISLVSQKVSVKCVVIEKGPAFLLRHAGGLSPHFYPRV